MHYQRLDMGIMGIIGNQRYGVKNNPWKKQKEEDMGIDFKGV